MDHVLTIAEYIDVDGIWEIALKNTLQHMGKTAEEYLEFEGEEGNGERTEEIKEMYKTVEAIDQYDIPLIDKEQRGDYELVDSEGRFVVTFDKTETESFHETNYTECSGYLLIFYIDISDSDFWITGFCTEEI